MTTATATIRPLLVLALIAALGGCYSIRHRNDAETATADGKPAPKAAKKGKEAREVLPTGLAGDTANHAYTDTPR